MRAPPSQPLWFCSAGFNACSTVESEHGTSAAPARRRLAWALRLWAGVTGMPASSCVLIPCALPHSFCRSWLCHTALHWSSSRTQTRPWPWPRCRAACPASGAHCWAGTAHELRACLHGCDGRALLLHAMQRCTRPAAAFAPRPTCNARLYHACCPGRLTDHAAQLPWHASLPGRPPPAPQPSGPAELMPAARPASLPVLQVHDGGDHFSQHHAG